MNLRYYQTESIEAIERDMRLSNKLLLWLATGTGKTIIFASLISQKFRQKGKVLVLAHRQELLYQARTKILTIDPGILCVIEFGDKTFSMHEYARADVIIASVQTLGRKGSKRLARLNPEDFSAIIIDEAHHSVASGYLTILDHFGVNKSGNDTNKNITLVGVTATPVRTDNKETLRDTFDKISYKYDLIQGINDGFLSDIRVINVYTDTNLSDIGKTGGDYNLGALETAVNTPERNRMIVNAYEKHAQIGSTIVFTVDRRHNEDLQKTFRTNGFESDVIDGTTPDTKRQDILNRLRNGELPIIINCAILTEGFDAPDVRNIMLCRPTISQTLYMQQIGRGTRIAEGKEYVTIIDFVDNSNKYSPVDMASVLRLPLGTKTDNQSIKHLAKEISEKGGGVIPRLITVKRQGFVDKGLLFETIDFLKHNIPDKSRFRWINTIVDEWIMPLPVYQIYHFKDDDKKLSRPKFRLTKDWDGFNLYFEDIGINITILKSLDIPKVDSIITRFFLANDQLEVKFFLNNQHWQRGDISDKQKDFVKKLLKTEEISDLEGMSKGDAGLLISLLTSPEIIRS